MEELKYIFPHFVRTQNQLYKVYIPLQFHSAQPQLIDYIIHDLYRRTSDTNNDEKKQKITPITNQYRHENQEFFLTYQYRNIYKVLQLYKIIVAWNAHTTYIILRASHHHS